MRVVSEQDEEGERLRWPSVDAFYESAYPRLVAALHATAGSRDEAEEIAQEAFLKLLPRWHKVRDYEDPESWVRTVAWRIAISRWRRSRVAQAGLRLLARAAPEATPEASRLPVELFDGLGLAQRQVLVMHYFLDLPIAQIAAELGVKEGTVKSRLARARDAVRANLSRDESARPPGGRQ